MALRPATPMLRLLTQHTAAKQGRIDEPLRIQAVTCTPNDPRLAKIDAERERRNLEKALEKVCQRGEVHLEWLEHATIQSFDNCVKGSFHVVHFIGHAEARWNEQEGVLFFEDDDSHIDAMSAEVLAVCLKESDVRFLFLNACETGDGDGNVAKILVERAVPVAIGMQSPVADDIAITLAGEFYGALADGLPIDAALVEGRKA